MGSYEFKKTLKLKKELEIYRTFLFFLTNTTSVKSIRKHNKTKRGKAQSLSNETFTILSEQQQKTKKQRGKNTETVRVHKSAARGSRLLRIITLCFVALQLAVLYVLI